MNRQMNPTFDRWIQRMTVLATVGTAAALIATAVALLSPGH